MYCGTYQTDTDQRQISKRLAVTYLGPFKPCPQAISLRMSFIHCPSADYFQGRTPSNTYKVCV